MQFLANIPLAIIHQPQMPHMLFHCTGENHVVSIDTATFSKTPESLLHESLKHCGPVAYPKGHHPELVQSIACSKHSFLLGRWTHTNLLVTVRASRVKMPFCLPADPTCHQLLASEKHPSRGLHSVLNNRHETSTLPTPPA